MAWAKVEAEASPDPSRKTGCVIEVYNGPIYAHNCFPGGVHVTEGRLQRPAKYTFMEHAERNAIYFAAAKGHPTLGAVMFLTWYPCADCARAIVCSGIADLYAYEPDWPEERYGFRDAEAILREGGVEVHFLERTI
jgi:dCMP deaminase